MAHFAALKRILQRHEDAAGTAHLALMCAPDGVMIEDDADATGFVYRDLSYQYDRDLDMVFELRAGFATCYTQDGSVAWACRTDSSLSPLLSAVELEPRGRAQDN